MKYADGSTLKFGDRIYFANGKQLSFSNQIYYSTGQIFKRGDLLFYPDGRNLSSGQRIYYPNGQQLMLSGSFYYPSGQVFKSRINFYHPNGQHVRFGDRLYNLNGEETKAPVHLAAPIGGFGYLLAYVDRYHDRVELDFTRFRLGANTHVVHFSIDQSGHFRMVVQIDSGKLYERIELTIREGFGTTCRVI
jgi:hypothetical protein